MEGTDGVSRHECMAAGGLCRPRTVSDGTATTRKDEATIQSQLPDDPLGFCRVDGWDLAAEKGTLAVEAHEIISRLIATVLTDAICDIVLSGMCLSRAIGVSDDPDPELWWFVRERLQGFNPG